MKKLWNWFRGTHYVWIELNDVDNHEVIKRKVHISPFDGIYVWYYEASENGQIWLRGDMTAICTDCTWLVPKRWVTKNHRPLFSKLQQALAIGEVTRNWGKK